MGGGRGERGGDLKQQDSQGGGSKFGGQLPLLRHDLQHEGGGGEGEGSSDDYGLVHGANGGQLGGGVEDLDQDLGADAVAHGQGKEGERRGGESHGEGAQTEGILR
jgi:hypothetical protein